MPIDRVIVDMVRVMPIKQYANVLNSVAQIFHYTSC